MTRGRDSDTKLTDAEFLEQQRMILAQRRIAIEQAGNRAYNAGEALLALLRQHVAENGNTQAPETPENSDNDASPPSSPQLGR